MEAELLGQIDKNTTQVFEPSSDKPRQRTADEVLSEHNDFLQKTLNECLLSNRDLVRTLTKLMTTCLLFSDQMKLFIEQTQIVSPYFMISFPC